MNLVDVTEEQLAAREADLKASDRLAELQTEIENEHDRVKYHEKVIPNMVEWLAGLADELNGIKQSLENEDDRTHELGYSKAFMFVLGRVKTEILENKNLKTRGDMLKVLQKMKDDFQEG